MEIYWQYGPQLAAMALLLCGSAFFSCSEAALFFLGREDRRALQSRGVGGRVAATLLAAPERLLSAILFWNLLVNIAYFALGSIVSVRLETLGRRAETGTFAVGTLLAIILLGEMLPKNVAVLRPRLVARLVSIPLAAAVRILDPLMPVLGFANLLSRRLLFPRFQSEPYLDVSDLERAIALGTHDQALVQQEQGVLQNIVALSELRTEEVMRPRPRYELFRPPVNLKDLKGHLPLSGYVLVSERESDEVAAAIPLKYLTDVPAEHLEHYAEKVVYVPWCATVATALEELRRLGRNVAAVVNEHGETVGIITMEDIFQTVVQQHADRSDRLLQTASISVLDNGSWVVTGITTLRRLGKQLQVSLPETKSVTIAGVLHEQLQRIPQAGDVVRWGGFEITVMRAPERGRLTARLERVQTPGQTS